MTQTYQSGYKSYLTQGLSAAGTTMYLKTVPTVTKGRLLLSNGTIKEKVSFSGVSGSTVTGLVRGLSNTADPATAGTGLDWGAGTQVILVAMHDQLVDKNETTPFVGEVTATDMSFTGTTTAGLKAKSLTTTQRNAITNAANGDIIYNTTAGEFQVYQGGAWVTLSSGSTQPNASATVAGKVEIATSAESIAGTDTGGTGALLSILPSDIAKNIQSGTFEYGVDVGGDDTYVVALTPTLAAYTTGQELKAKMTTANTGACTIDFGPGVKSVKMIDGTDPYDGAIGASKVHTFIYDGTSLILQNPVSTFDGIDSFTAGASITAWNALHISPYTQTDGGITYDNKNSSGFSNATNPTLSFTVGSGNNRILLVHVLHNLTLTSITYNGVAMTLVDTQAGSAGGFTIGLYRLYAPSTGANTIAVTGTGVFGIAAISYSNVLQSTGIEASAKGTTTASLTTLTQGAVVYAAGGYYGSSGGTFSGGFSAGTKYSSSAAYVNAIGTASSTFYILGGDTGKINEVIALTCANNGTNTGGGTTGWASIAVSIVPVTAVSLGVVPTTTTQSVFNEPLIDFIGFAQSTVAIGASVDVKEAGIVTGLSGLTAGIKYYLTSSNGALSATRGVYGKLVGTALSSTTLLIGPEKTMGSNIVKNISYTYTAETDGFVTVRASSASTLITDGVTFTVAAGTSSTIPVSKKKTYIASAGVAEIYFIPQA